MEKRSRTPLGQLLLAKEVITQEQLDDALAKQKITGELLGTILLKLGFVDEENVYLPILAEQLGVEYVQLKNLEITKECIKKIPSQFISHYKIIPFDFKENSLSIATTHPLDINIMDAIGLICPYKVKMALAGSRDILEAIRKYYGVGAETLEKMMGQTDFQRTEIGEVDNIEEIDSEATIGKFINQILMEAYKDRATDVHVEPFEDELKVRYRVDGVLYDAQVPPNIWHFRDSIISRIKIMSNLNIVEKRLPQDGRFKVRVGDIDLDLRVSFLPTQYGESVVVRILSSTKLYNMDELGLSSDHQRKLDEIIKKPHGIVFVTGPTGSGKTTTLYSCLTKINKTEKKIITIEDPIEYQLKGITQMQINPAIGLTFAQGLRSMLRHDPDIMMVGEVRDLETAEIAFQVALTGHLVFSTLHTNDAASAVTRLLDMGVEPYLIVSSVECFVAQRLVRLICPKCKEASKAPEDLLEDMGVSVEGRGGVKLFKGKGCKNCNGTGYYGREGIYEFLFLGDEIKQLITNRASATEIKNKAVSLGMRTLLDFGWDKVKEGITTPQEVIRVTKEERNE